MKNFLLCLFLMFGIVLFSGCSTNASVNYVNTKISSIFITVSCNDHNLTQIGINTQSKKDEFKEEMERLSRQYIDQISLKFRNAINELSSQGILSANERVFYKNHLDSYIGWDDNVFIIELRFHSATASRIFMKYCGEMDTEITSSLFITNVSEKITGLMNTFPSNLIPTTVTNYYNDAFVELFNNFENVLIDEFEGVSVKYMFVSTNKRLHSNGIVLDSVDGVIHYFADNVEGDIFVFYRVEANRYMWYLLALTVTMIFIAVYLIVIYFLKK